MVDSPQEPASALTLWDTLLMNVRVATMADAASYGIIENGAIGLQSGRIVWVGDMNDLPETAESPAHEVVECAGIWVTPGLIDCHNHLLYGGHFHSKAADVVQATRQISEDRLLEASAKRLVPLLAEGVTTVGLTFGYGEDEAVKPKLTEALRLLESIFPVRLLAQFEGGMTLPEVYAGNARAFSDEGIHALVGQVALLYPGVFYTSDMMRPPLVAELRNAHIAMAIATDCNPLTSPCSSLLLMMNMACRFFGLTPAEALLGVTRHAAKILNMENSIGTVEVGKQADLVLWDIAHPDELSYNLGFNPCVGAIHAGVLRRSRD